MKLKNYYGIFQSLNKKEEILKKELKDKKLRVFIEKFMELVHRRIEGVKRKRKEAEENIKKVATQLALKIPPKSPRKRKDGSPSRPIPIFCKNKKFF